MALTVVVRSSEAEASPRITFDAPRIVIGRGDGCEVRLPDPSVSHRHASIRQRGTDYIVLDEGSTNGTFVGPVRLSAGAPRILTNGDLVRVGRVWLEILIEQVPPTQNAPVATRELALALVASALTREGESAGVKVRVVEGPSAGTDGVLEAFDKPFVVGRMQAADLNVDDADLSRRHVEVTRRADKILVKDLGSKNGSKLGDRALVTGEDTVWPKGEVLHIGKTAIVYDDPVGEALAELERAADDRVPEGELIEPPHGAKTPTSDPPTGVPASSAARGAPVTPRPRRDPSESGGGWTLLDVFVVMLALVVLAVSIGGLIWLMRGGG